LWKVVVGSIHPWFSRRHQEEERHLRQ